MIGRNLASLTSFFKYLRTYPYPVKCAFGGYSIDWEPIEPAIEDSCVLLKLDRNYGKAYTVNKIIEEASKVTNFNYILTADSDIIFDTQCPHMFSRLVGMANFLNTKPFGMIGLNQKEANVHSSLATENRIDFNGEVIYYPSVPAGIAGGCIFTSYQAWQAVGGYRVMGVYAGEDGWYLRDLEEKGFGYYLSESVYIIHPPEEDNHYARWKLHQSTINGTKVDSLDSWVDAADQFWKSKD